MQNHVIEIACLNHVILKTFLLFIRIFSSFTILNSYYTEILYYYYLIKFKSFGFTKEHSLNGTYLLGNLENCYCIFYQRNYKNHFIKIKLHIPWSSIFLGVQQRSWNLGYLKKWTESYNATMNVFETVGKNILIENSQSSKSTTRIFLQVTLKLWKWFCIKLMIYCTSQQPWKKIPKRHQIVFLLNMNCRDRSIFCSVNCIIFHW